MPNSLPTPEEMLAAAQRELDKAYRALGDAGDSPEERRRLDAVETAAANQRGEMKRRLQPADSHRDRAVIAQADARGIANSATRS